MKAVFRDKFVVIFLNQSCTSKKVVDVLPLSTSVQKLLNPLLF